MMPARIAATDPFKPIGEYIGSGPMRFVREEWVPGARAVFERFSDYVPRQEPQSWLSGGKQMLLDRIEWIVMADPGTASAALQNGEVDWWETPMADLVPVLKKNRNVMVDIADPLGNIGSFRMNHLHPPFNDVRARRAILTASSRLAHRSTARKAAKFSKVRVVSMLPSDCWRRADIPVSRSPAWWRRICQSPKLRAKSLPTCSEGLA